MFIRWTMDTTILNHTAMVTTFMEVMVMERDLLRLNLVMVLVLLLTIHMEVTVLSTEALRVLLEAMVVMVMARDLPSQVTMAVVTLMSTSPVPTIMEIMAMTFTTLTTQDMDMARGQLNLDTMDTAMAMLKAINMSPDITQTMALKF